MSSLADRNGRYRIDLEPTSAWRLETQIGERVIQLEIPPPIYPIRLPPLDPPELRQVVVRAFDATSGKPLADVRVTTTGSRLEHGFVAVPAHRGTSSTGVVRFALFEGEGLRVEGFEPARPITEKRLATGILELRLRRLSENPSSKRTDGPARIESSTLRVTDTRGAPIADAAVWSNELPSCHGVTDERGVTTIPVDVSSTRYLVATAPGFEVERLAIDELRAETEIRLESSASALTGRVVDPDGRPLEDARVDWREPERIAFTDAEGRFTFRGTLLERLGTFVTSRPGFLTRRDEAMTAPLVELDRVERRWMLARPTTVRGRLLEANGAPSDGVSVSLARPPRAGEEEIVTRTDERGNFELPGIPNGRRALRLEKGGEVLGLVGLEAEPRGGLHDLGTIELGPTSIIRGQVVDQDGVPVPGAAIHVDPSTGPRVRAPVNIEGEPSIPVIGYSDPGGFFEVHGFSGPRLGLGFSKPGYATRSLVVRHEDGEERLEIELPRLSSRKVVIVSAEDSSPLAQAVVISGTVGLDEPGLWGDSNAFFTDHTGEIVLEGYPGARGEISITRDGFVGVAREVVFDDPDDPLVVALTPEAALTGKVFAPTGDPVPGVTIGRFLDRPAPMPSGDRTDPDGSYRLDGLKVGTLTVYLRSSRFGEERRTVEISPGENHVDFHLRDPGHYRLSGEIEVPGGISFSSYLVARGPAGKEWISPVDPGGGFRYVDLPGGRYTFSLRPSPFPHRLEQGASLELDADIDRWQIVVERVEDPEP